MENFKFTSLLSATPLSEEDKYNLTVIFGALWPARQIDIIDHWEWYLDKILQIHWKAREERNKQIQETFTKINQMIDEAYLREQEKKEQEAQEKSIRDANLIAAIEYDQKRKIAEIRKKEQEIQIAREKLLDPLAFI